MIKWANEKMIQWTNNSFNFPGNPRSSAAFSSKASFPLNEKVAQSILSIMNTCPGLNLPGTLCVPLYNLWCLDSWIEFNHSHNRFRHWMAGWVKRGQKRKLGHKVMAPFHFWFWSILKKRARCSLIGFATSGGCATCGNSLWFILTPLPTAGSSSISWFTYIGFSIFVPGVTRTFKGGAS